MSVIKDPRLSWLFIGSSRDAKNIGWLKRNHIRYIINCTDNVEEGGVPNYHQSDNTFAYCRLPISDNDSELLKHHYQKGWEFIHRCLVREDGACLVHCKLGVSRSAALVTSFLIKFMRLSYTEATNLLVASRPQVCPNSDFRQQLRELSDQLQNNPDDYWTLPFTNPSESLLFSGRFMDAWNKTQPKPSTVTRPIGPFLPPNFPQCSPPEKAN